MFFNPKNGKTKIGITNNLKRRESGIEGSVEGMDIRLIYSIKIYNARNVEKWLHDEYNEVRRVERFGNGKNEWFLLNWSQREWIRWYLRFVWVIQQVQITTIYVLVLTSIMFFLIKMIEY